MKEQARRQDTEKQQKHGKFQGTSLFSEMLSAHLKVHIVSRIKPRDDSNEPIESHAANRNIGARDTENASEYAPNGKICRCESAKK